jgi:hypothetical protein
MASRVLESPALLIAGLVGLRLARAFGCVWLERSRRKTLVALKQEERKTLLAQERERRKPPGRYLARSVPSVAATGHQEDDAKNHIDQCP